MRPLKSLIALAFIALLATMWSRHADTPPASRGPDAATLSQAPATRSTPDALPVEARDMLERIARGGPFQHSQDGAVFGNYEGLLPQQPRGYYREYTVETPGARHRGARRIVTGGTPPVVWYYTDDHYRSFRRFEVAR